MAEHGANDLLQNGVGAFILQCKRLDFHYSDWAGSSTGLKYGAINCSFCVLVSMVLVLRRHRLQTISSITPLYKFHVSAPTDPSSHLA